MAAVGNPYQNGAAESFMKTLKVEEVYLKDYQTLEEARANMEHFLREVYNEQRLHSALGYRPPSEFEQVYYQGLLS
jgi:putative transposase